MRPLSCAPENARQGRPTDPGAQGNQQQDCYHPLLSCVVRAAGESGGTSRHAVGGGRWQPRRGRPRFHLCCSVMYCARALPGRSVMADGTELHVQL
eukprot:scaffold3274_cov188-Prasinococcus_capsulatus_cf.AAC.1